MTVTKAKDARETLARVVDPEIPVITIAELGILRAVVCAAEPATLGGLFARMFGDEHVWQTAWAEIMKDGVTPQTAGEKAFKRVEEIFANYPIA